MLKKIPAKKIVALIIAISIIITGYTYANETTANLDNLEEDLLYLGAIINHIQENYKFDIDQEELVKGAYNGVFEMLDQHSTYFTPEDFESFNIESSGTFGGIGITVGERNDYITIIAPIKGTPGDKAGLKAGDIIKYVDDEDITGYSIEEAVKLMRGEPGTKVKLGIIRGNNPNVIYFDIVRDVIKVSPVEYEIIENNIGYIKIVQFNNNTDENVKIALNELKDKNVSGLIVDLRNNPGGILDEVIKTADFFLPKNSTIVHIDYKGEYRDTHKARTNKILDVPLAVLVDNGSASASEIFAGAVQDNKAGTIIGTTTFGKGTVQNTTPITNGGGIKLTIAEYLTSSEKKIDGVGITPDIIIKNLDEESQKNIPDFAPMIEDEASTLNDKGLNVYGAQQRLKYIGYDIEVTGIMDEKSVEVIKSFQKTQGINTSGTLDWITREKINEKTLDVYNYGTKDLQLEKAIDIIKSKK